MQFTAAETGKMEACDQAIADQVEEPTEEIHIAVMNLNEEIDFAKVFCWHLKTNVPHIYTDEMKPLGAREEKLVQSAIIKPIEWYLFGEDPNAFMEKLRQNETPPVCGKMFREGETTYSCRDCAIDSTCVLCMDCFQKSIHKEHKYKVHTSLGGGFCDCGDAEAWKTGPYCKHHEPGVSDDAENSGFRLPEKVLIQTKKVFPVIIRYIVDMLIWFEEKHLPPYLVSGIMKTDLDLHYCVLFNDENHSYEQVIYTLRKSLHCSQKEAQAFATAVDKEGRYAVKKSNFEKCRKIAQNIKTLSDSVSLDSLHVEVLHEVVMDHQRLAVRLASWLTQLLNYSRDFRQTFCDVCLHQESWFMSKQMRFITMLIMWDAKLHKGFRKVLHDLMFTGFFMEIEYKKLFALEFVSLYTKVQNDYMDDDHDRSISITAISVQVFTVPTLARLLIEERDVITVITQTILDVIPEYVDTNNKFNFQGYSEERFNRVYAIICDLKYILVCKPTVWTEKLKSMFLQGFKSFLRILSSMQGIDAISRPIQQEADAETDWEAGVRIQMHLQSILRLMQEWCASNDDILLEAYKECYRAVMDSIHPDSSEKVLIELCGHSFEGSPYRVSKDSVSMHLPLSRLLAGLHSQMSRTGIITRLSEIIPREDFKIELLLEFPLRWLVLLGQISAGMWCRKGIAILSQVYYYQSVKNREELYDKDILMLQIGASYMEPNSFLLMILQKYELEDAFIEKEPIKEEELAKQRNLLIQEMLSVLISIIGERYVPGLSNITKEECLMRELIHLLCIESKPHSEIVSGLPDFENTDLSLDAVISKVANFKRPSISGHGVYELKEEYFDQYNLFFYHYSKTLHCKAEQAQKKRRKQESGSEALPPPPAPEFSPAFHNVSHLLCCDVMMEILRTIMQRAIDDDPNAWTEGMLQMVLHILAMGLLEEKQQLQKAAEEEVTFDFYHKATSDESAGSPSIVNLLEKLKSVTRLAGQKDMINWVWQMFETLKRLREKSDQTALATSAYTDDLKVDESSKEEEKRSKRKSEAARLHRQKIMAQMSALQKNFIETNKHLYATPLEVDKSQMPPEESLGPKIALGPKRGHSVVEKQVLTCILCQEEQEVRLDNATMVLAACVQKSTVLSQNRGKSYERSCESSNPIFTNPALSYGLHTGSCGHVMHVVCWQKFFDAMKVNSGQSLYFEQFFDYGNGEFLCPLCKCFCNTVIPVIPDATQKINNADADAIGQVLSLRCWLDVVSARIAGCNLKTSTGEKTIVPEFSKNHSHEYHSILSFGVQPVPDYSAGTKEMIAHFASTLYRVDLNIASDKILPRLPLLTWNTCAFTIQCLENELGSEDKPLFESLQHRRGTGLKALAKIAEAQRVVCPQSMTQKHLIRLLSVFLPNMKLEDTPCFLSVEAFHLLVGSVLAFPSLYLDEFVDLQPSPITSAFNHLYLFHLVTMTHIVQIIVTSASDSLPDKVPNVEEAESEEAESAAALCRELSRLTNGCLFSDLPGWHVWDFVRKGIMPYLRCSAIFFHYLLGVTPPEELQSASPEDNMKILCSYLGLPNNLFRLFQDYAGTMEPLLQRWCSDETVLSLLKGKTSMVRYPRKLNILIDLPDDYSCLLNKASHFKCPKSLDSDGKNPMLCLLCGAMLCSQTLCCQGTMNGDEVGPCTLHAISCGAGVCMFLRIRECRLIVIEGKTRGCMLAAPYLDEYGETDEGFRRGNPLRLSRERYWKLQLLWQQHRLIEEIAHSLENSQVTTIGFNFHML